MTDQGLPTQDAAIVAFRLTRRRPGDAGLPYELAHVARESVCKDAAAWTWRFDPANHQRPRFEAGILPEVACPVTQIRAGNGLMCPEMAAAIAARVRAPVTMREVADVAHRVMFD